MVTMLMLALAITTQDSPDRHVRATDPKILSLIGSHIRRRSAVSSRR